MSTLPITQQGAARAPEADAPAQAENGLIRLVLVDEGLERGVHDVDLALETGHAPCSRDQIVSQIHDRPGHGYLDTTVRYRVKKPGSGARITLRTVSGCLPSAPL